LAHPTQSINWLGFGSKLVPYTGRVSVSSNILHKDGKASSVTTGNPPVAPPSSESPWIALVSTPAFCLLQRQEGSNTFQLHLSDSSFVKAISASASAPVNMSSILEEYHDFPDMFSKAKADKPAPHRPYGLKIDLEDEAAPPLGPIYSLYQSEVQSLWEFINEHLNMGFICPLLSPQSAPVLFVKKKDGSLCLCIDFRSLNPITKNENYLLPWISDISNMLDTPHKAKIYTKIDLWHAYHLVQIREGDKWKTTFPHTTVLLNRLLCLLVWEMLL
jgi:hypothetical protein